MGGYIKRNAGLKVYFKLESPYGQRIQQIFVGENELTPDEIYDVVFVTEQAVPKDVGSNRRELSIRAIEAMERYLEKTAYDRDDFESYIPV